MLEKRVKELEDMVFKQQGAVKTYKGDSNHERVLDDIFLVSDLPIKIQIHQEEIERFRKDSKKLKMKNRKWIASGRWA